jgi:hypothetical protein
MQGSTIVEVAVVGAICTIVALMVLSGRLRQLPRYTLDEATMHVGHELRAARMQAVSENMRVQVGLSTTPPRLTVWGDRDRDGLLDAGEEQTNRLDGCKGLTIAANCGTGRFDPRGQLDITNACWAIRLSVDGGGTRDVHVLPGGHVKIWSSASDTGE